MREWLWLALAATSLACSGGRDPVRTVGGDGEYEGPGASDPFGSDDDEHFTTSISTLLALCTKVCAHLRAADCDGAPAHTTGACASLCSQEVSSFPASCADEAAAAYTCSLGAKVTCSETAGDVPMVTSCDDEESDLKKCLSPDSNCVTSMQVEVTCLSLGLTTFVFCPEEIEAPPECLQISSTSFCCP
jgi:hypothetical protein